MPVYLHQIQQPTEVERLAVARICKGIEATDELSLVLQRWQNCPDEFKFFGAIFNERMVGFALLESNEIKALVVHSATRNRGVGQRILDELLRLNSGVKLPESCKDSWLQRRFSLIAG